MKTFLLTAFIALASSYGFAAPLKGTDTQKTQDSKNKYPFLVPAKFNFSCDYVKATFVSDNVVHEAYYSQDGELVGISKATSLQALPEVVKTKLSTEYAAFNLKEAIQFDGFEESAIFVSAENDKQHLILKVSNETVEIFKTTSKK